MGLNFFVNGRAKHAESLGLPQPVIDSNSLREAALRASWHRDHRVARRREAWRWAMFWAWKYGPKAFAVILLISLACYVVVGLWTGTFKRQPSASSSPSAPVAPAAQIPPVRPANELPTNLKTGIRLVPAIALRPDPGIQTLTKRSFDESNPPPSQPLRLTPEIQTSPKESAP